MMTNGSRLEKVVLCCIIINSFVVSLDSWTAETASGTDLTGWVALDEEGKVSFTLQDAAAYRTKAASKACPGFDVIDYGQEDYVFGDSDTNARHWSTFVLRALEENEAALSPLFNR